jgi:hypothetical protein
MITKRGTPTPFDRVISASALRKSAQEASFGNRVLRPFVDRVINPSNQLLKNFDFNAVRERLMQGGFPRGLTAKEFVFIKILLPILLAFLFLTLVPAWAGMMGMNAAYLAIPAMLLGAL